MAHESHIISSQSGEYARTVWYFPGPKAKTHPLCVFLDGEHYLRDMDCLPLLQQLIKDGAIPPVSLLFVSHVSSDPAKADYACRLSDYACNDRYAQFIAEDVVRWAKARTASIQSKGNVICGLSLSGLASAYLAFSYPKIFSAALCQSGSFWWLADKDITFPPTKAKFWLSVGDKETATDVTHAPGLHQKISQIVGVGNAAKEFEHLGEKVHYQLYEGGHAPGPWKQELPAALKWLIR